MTSHSRTLVVVLDIAVWALIAWLVLCPPDAYTRARAAWHTTRACWAVASWFGRLAMQAELRYNLEMESQR